MRERERSREGEREREQKTGRESKKERMIKRAPGKREWGWGGVEGRASGSTAITTNIKSPTSDYSARHFAGVTIL